MAEWMVAADMEINIPGDSTAVGSEIDAAPCRSDSSVRPGYRDPRRPHRMVAIRHTHIDPVVRPDIVGVLRRSDNNDRGCRRHSHCRSIEPGGFRWGRPNLGERRALRLRR
jgi:hypothetical protein